MALAHWDVIIIGGGASGTLTALQLLRRASVPLRIGLLDKEAAFARGVAYSTRELCHLLNVPAGRMSAFPDKPEHFLTWVQEGASEATASDFIPRLKYGDYLEELLAQAQQQALPGVSLERMNVEALKVSAQGSEAGYRVEGTQGRTMHARAVVLALGNLPPAPLAIPDGGLFASPHYAPSPWAPAALENIAPEDALLLVGTGLTAIDVALSLLQRGHRGQVHALSRHGLLPRAHESKASSLFARLALPKSTEQSLDIRSLLHAVRQAMREADSGGRSWRDVMDGLRPRTLPLWQALPMSERRRFLRHLRPYWEVHRHRMAPAVSRQLEDMVDRGQLHLHAGHLRAFEMAGSKVKALYRPRGSKELKTLSVFKVINCTGPAAPGRGQQSPLLRSLMESGWARPDALGLGLDTEDGRVKGQDGRSATSLFALGPLRRGELWESTAIPELRLQAEETAMRVLQALDIRSF